MNLLKRLVFVIAGAAPIGVIAWILHWTEWTLMSWTVFRIVPLGALFIGVVGGAGFLFAARRLDIRASKWVYLLMVSCTASLYFLVSYLHYREFRTSLDGQPLSFRTYLDLSIRTSTLVRSSGSTRRHSGPLGGDGYYYVLLQLGGLTLGSSVVFLGLCSFKYCRECSRYYVGTASNTRYYYSAADFSVNASAIKSLLESGSIVEGLSLHSNAGRPAAKSPDASLRTYTKISRCPGCNRRQLTYRGQKWNEKRDWEDVLQLSLDLDLPPVNAEQTGGLASTLKPEITYELSRDGVYYGPYTQSDLRQYVKDGNVLLTDRVRRTDSGEWCDVSTALTI